MLAHSDVLDKLRVLFELVQTLDERDEKTIVVSNSSSTLDLIAALFRDARLQVFRLDEAAPSERRELIRRFNEPNLYLDRPGQVRYIFAVSFVACYWPV